MKTKNTRKGFTTVELVIVIAVIAILATVLIPTFSNMIESANLSVDKQNVRNMNVCLQTYSITDGDPSDFGKVKKELKEYGYGREDNFQTKSEGFSIRWHSGRNVIFLVNPNGQVEYPDEYKGNAAIAAELADKTMCFDLSLPAAIVTNVSNPGSKMDAIGYRIIPYIDSFVNDFVNAENNQEKDDVKASVESMRDLLPMNKYLIDKILDCFDNYNDEGEEELKRNITEVLAPEIAVMYTFEPTEDPNEKFANWVADFHVTFEHKVDDVYVPLYDKNIVKNLLKDVQFAGYFYNWEVGGIGNDTSTDEEEWLFLSLTDEITFEDDDGNIADVEYYPVDLLAADKKLSLLYTLALIQNGGDVDKAKLEANMINYGMLKGHLEEPDPKNPSIKKSIFKCGVVDADGGDDAGVKMSVQLRLTNPDVADGSDYQIIGIYSYIFK